MSPYSFQQRRKQLWLSWWKLCALVLTATYSTLFLFAALCLATGIFHPEASHDHAKYPHHHTDADTHHPAVLLDICDFAWQALITTAWHLAPLPSVALAQGETITPLNVPVVFPEPDASASIRAPPWTLS